jgi:hypothetical protein
MVPPLSKGVVNRHNWGRFIDFIREHYKNDTEVEIKPNYINFKAGEHPKLPFEGHRFLRFSSKVSGSTAADTKVDSYITIVTFIAHAHFASRNRFWHEGADEFGTYDWNEVNESLRSYEQVRGASPILCPCSIDSILTSYSQLDELETPTSIAQLLSGTDPIKELGIAPLGLFARFNISEGTQIICEKPLLTVGPMPPNESEPFLATKLKALSKVSQRQFLFLHNNFLGKYSINGIVKTNALPCGSGSPVGGVYLTVAFRTLTTAGTALKNTKPSTRSDRSKAERRSQFHTIMEARQVYDRHS